MQQVIISSTIILHINSILISIFILAGLLFGILNVKISRQAVIAISTIVNLTTIFAILANIPPDAPTIEHTCGQSKLGFDPK
jgi:hypothetical protein